MNCYMCDEEILSNDDIGWKNVDDYNGEEIFICVNCQERLFSPRLVGNPNEKDSFFQDK